MEVIMCATYLIHRVRLEQFVDLFNRFTNVNASHEADFFHPLWVGMESMAERKVVTRYDFEASDDEVYEIHEDLHGYPVQAWNSWFVQEVKFVSLTSGDVLRWTEEIPPTEDESSGLGTLELIQRDVSYKGAYYEAFMEVASK